MNLGSVSSQPATSFWGSSRITFEGWVSAATSIFLCFPSKKPCQLLHTNLGTHQSSKRDQLLLFLRHGWEVPLSCPWLIPNLPHSGFGNVSWVRVRIPFQDSPWMGGTEGHRQLGGPGWGPLLGWFSKVSCQNADTNFPNRNLKGRPSFTLGCPPGRQRKVR